MIDNDPLSESKDGSNNLIHIDNLDEYNYHLTSPKNDNQQFKEELLSESFTNGSRNHQQYGENDNKDNKLSLKQLVFKSKYDHQIDSPMRTRMVHETLNSVVEDTTLTNKGKVLIENRQINKTISDDFTGYTKKLESEGQTHSNDNQEQNEIIALKKNYPSDLKTDDDPITDSTKVLDKEENTKVEAEAGEKVHELEKKETEELKAESPKKAGTTKKKKVNRLIINTYNTVYPLITDAAKVLGLRARQVDPNLSINPYQQMDALSNPNNSVPQPEEFDICWFDLQINPEILYRIKSYQRISQWPGIQVIAHKNKLGKNLMQMKKEFSAPGDYDFFPETYLIPQEMNEFKKQFIIAQQNTNENPECGMEENQGQYLGTDKNYMRQTGRYKQNSMQIRTNNKNPQFLGNDKMSTAETTPSQKNRNTDKIDTSGLSEHGIKSYNKFKMNKGPEIVLSKNEKITDSDKKGNNTYKSSPEKRHEAPIFIIKPECQSQGRGIYLTSTPENIPPHDHVVAQRYLQNPYLIDGLKFDLRIYVLLNGISPLRAYVFDEGLARFATSPYEEPNPKNLNNMFMHLTNYAINKNADNYKQNENEEGKGRSHKRSLNQIYKHIAKQGHDVDALKSKIDDLIVKTLITGQPSMWHVYRSCQPEDIENQLCFQILGFDVMLDSDLKPWLIEVNHAPSLATDAAFDLKVKKDLVEDTLRILNLNSKRKQTYINIQKSQFQKRILTGKTQKLTAEEKEVRRLEIDKQRDTVEPNLVTGYRQIYPCYQNEEKMMRYKKMLETSRQLYEYFTKGGKKIKEGKTLKAQIEQEKEGKDGKPPWKSTGVGTMPQWNKPSKYQVNCNIKAKVQTGLGAGSSAQQTKESYGKEKYQESHSNIEPVIIDGETQIQNQKAPGHQSSNQHNNYQLVNNKQDLKDVLDIPGEQLFANDSPAPKRWNERFNSTMTMRAEQRALYHRMVNSCVMNMPRTQKIQEQQNQIHNLIAQMAFNDKQLSQQLVNLHQRYMGGFGPQSKLQFHEATSALSSIIHGLQNGPYANVQAFDSLQLSGHSLNSFQIQGNALNSKPNNNKQNYNHVVMNNGINGINGTSFKLEQKKNDSDNNANQNSQAHRRKSTVCMMDRTTRKGRNQGYGSMPVKNISSKEKTGATSGQGRPIDTENYRSLFNNSMPISEDSQRPNDGKKPPISQSGQQPSTSRIAYQESNAVQSQQQLNLHNYYTQKIEQSDKPLNSPLKFQASQSDFNTYQGNRPQFIQHSQGSSNQMLSRQFSLTKADSAQQNELGYTIPTQVYNNMIQSQNAPAPTTLYHQYNKTQNKPFFHNNRGIMSDRKYKFDQSLGTYLNCQSLHKNNLTDPINHQKYGQTQKMGLHFNTLSDQKQKQLSQQSPSTDITRMSHQNNGGNTKPSFLNVPPQIISGYGNSPIEQNAVNVSNNIFEAEISNGSHQMNMQMTQPQFSSQRDFNDGIDKGYQQLGQFDSKQVNFSKGGTQKLIPNKAQNLMLQGELNQGKGLELHDKLEKEAQAYINQQKFSKTSHFARSRIETMNITSAQASKFDNEPPMAIHQNQNGLQQNFVNSSGIPHFSQKDISNNVINDQNNLSQQKRTAANGFHAQHQHNNGRTYNKVQASSNMSNGFSVMSQPDWPGSDKDTQQSRLHAQMISQNIQQWKRSQQEAAQLQLVQQSLNLKKAMTQKSMSRQGTQEDQQAEAVSPIKGNMPRANEALYSSTKGQAIMLPELACSTNGRHSNLQEASMHSHEKEKQDRITQSIKDDRKLKPYRQSAHSSQKQNTQKNQSHNKETINLDSAALNEYTGKSQHMIQQQVLQYGGSNIIQTQKAISQVNVNGQVNKIDGGLSSSAKKQSQRVIHGLSPQPAHLYQLASPNPFVAINLQKVNQPATQTMIQGALLKSVSPTTMIPSHFGGVVAQNVAASAHNGNSFSVQGYSPQKGFGIEAIPHQISSNQMQQRQMDASQYLPTGSMSTGKSRVNLQDQGQYKKTANALHQFEVGQVLVHRQLGASPSKNLETTVGSPLLRSKQRKQEEAI